MQRYSATTTMKPPLLPLTHLMINKICVRAYRVLFNVLKKSSGPVKARKTIDQGITIHRNAIEKDGIARVQASIDGLTRAINQPPPYGLSPDEEKEVIASIQNAPMLSWLIYTVSGVDQQHMLSLVPLLRPEDQEVIRRSIFTDTSDVIINRVDRVTGLN